MRFRHDVLPPLLVLLGLAVSLPATAALTTGPRPGAATTAAWVVAMTLPLLWRRRRPGTVTAVVALAFAAGQVAGVPENLVGQVSLVVALYTVGAVDAERRRAWLVRGGVVALFAVWVVVALVQRQPFGPGLDLAGPTGTARTAAVVLSVLGNVLVLGTATALGETAWVAATRRRALEARTAQLQRERDRVAAQAVALDRMRTARELHDVVAHHVSLTGVQASLARRLLDVAPERAAAALDEVEDSARRAVRDLGGLLLTLREDNPADPAADAPSTVGVHRLADLVADARRGGLRVRLHVDPRLGAGPGALAPVADLAVHRLVQEALTNTRKHAGPGADVAVEVVLDAAAGTAAAQEVLVAVRDDGGGPDVPGGGAGGGEGAGLGLVGMRERVTAAGGTLRTGPSGRGFAVTARLPLAGGAR